MADEQHEGVVILALEATRKTSQTAEGYSGEQKNTVESRGIQWRVSQKTVCKR
jgi:hypothetical protein